MEVALQYCNAYLERRLRQNMVMISYRRNKGGNAAELDGRWISINLDKLIEVLHGRDALSRPSLNKEESGTGTQPGN